MVRLAVLLLAAGAAAAAPAPASQDDPPPMQAEPRELAVQPDVRRVEVAVRKGFRTRVVCRGGCVTVKVRAFVSPLTARTYRLGDFKHDVQVAEAPTLHEAEGRHQAMVAFRRFARSRLARAKELKLAVEATAVDADGRVRKTVKRVVLRR